MAALTAYVTFIFNTPQVAAIDGSVNMDATLSMAPVGMNFTAGGPTVTIINAGVYCGKYRIQITVVLLHNGTAVTSSYVAVRLVYVL